MQIWTKYLEHEIHRIRHNNIELDDSNTILFKNRFGPKTNSKNIPRKHEYDH